MGKEATEFTRKLVEGKEVRLEYDIQRKDKFGSSLVYVYFVMCDPRCKYEGMAGYSYLEIDNKTYIFLNGTLVGLGFAQVMAIPPNVKYQALFLELQREAKADKRGLWR